MFSRAMVIDLSWHGQIQQMTNWFEFVSYSLDRIKENNNMSAKIFTQHAKF